MKIIKIYSNILEHLQSASSVRRAPNRLDPPRSNRTLDQHCEEAHHHHHHLEGICPDHSLQPPLNKTHTLCYTELIHVRK